MTEYRDVAVYICLPAVEAPPFRVLNKIYKDEDVTMDFTCEVRFALGALFGLRHRLTMARAIGGARSTNDLVAHVRRFPPGLLVAEIEKRDKGPLISC